MPLWLEELLIVFAYSRRTQLAIVLGMTSFVAILAVGDYFVGHVTFRGVLAPLTAAIRELLLDQYDKAAWMALAAFLLLAFKFYRKDRKRLLEM